MIDKQMKKKKNKKNTRWMIFQYRLHQSPSNNPPSPFHNREGFLGNQINGKKKVFNDDNSPCNRDSR